MKMVLSQNYFTFLNNVYLPTKGVALDSPISNIVIEVFLQFCEDKYVEHLLETKNITLCAHYIDTTKTDIELIMSSMNHVHGSIRFSPTHENNGQINFYIYYSQEKNLVLKLVYTLNPPTLTKVSNLFSTHPTEHIIAVYRYFIMRMQSHPLSLEWKQKEWNIMQHISKANNLSYTLIQKLNLQIQVDRWIHRFSICSFSYLRLTVPRKKFGKLKK
jgi:predicted nucleic acid-binding Zn finger protein